MKTIRESFEIYDRNVIRFRNQSTHTEEQHFVAMRSLLEYLGQDFPIRNLTFENIRDWKRELERHHLSDVTVRVYLIKIRLVLGYMRRMGIDCPDPTTLPLPVRSVTIPGVLTPEEVTRLVDAAVKIQNKLIISMLYSTALRVSALCALDRSTVKTNHFTVVTKGGAIQQCFIDERTRRLLDTYLATRTDDMPALFIARIRRARMTPNTVNELFKYLRKAAGFDWPVHPHTMRHSCLTNLIMNGAPIHAVQRLAGHKSLATTGFYLHIADPDLKAVHNKFHSIDTKPIL